MDSVAVAVEVEEKESLIEVLDFDMICSSVAMRTNQGKWNKLEENYYYEDKDEDDEELGGGVFRMWEGDLLDCLDHPRLLLQSSFCPWYRFGENMKLAGFGSCFFQGFVYIILATIALSNFVAFAVTKKHCFLYLGVAFALSPGTYLGFHRIKMRNKFNIKVCGGSWWSSPRATFNSSSFMANYGGCWQNDFMNMKTTRSTDESSGGCTSTISPDSAFQIMDSLPSTTTNWNQALLVNEESYNQTQPEILNQDSFIFCMDQQQASYGYPSSLLQTLFYNTPPPSPPSALPQQPLFDFHSNMNEFNSVSSMPGFSSLEKPKQQVLGGLHLANKTPFWNTAALDLNDNRAAFFTSTQSQYLTSTYGEKQNFPNIKSQSEKIQDLESSLKKGSSEPTFKRSRLETPSPFPTFKVRKEKLGDRVTALQQLVSPFGKTDTASVLHEAIEYIKLLHDQVNVLSTPYMKNGTTMQRQEIHDKQKDNMEGAKQQDLRGRGLCLVPVSSTFPVATETAPDYWTSSFGGTFR